MKPMRTAKHIGSAVAGALCLLLASAAQSVPTPVAPPAGLSPNLIGRWVDVDLSPHSIGDADAALAGTAPFTILNEVLRKEPVVNHHDGCCAGTFFPSPPTLLDPLTPDDSFAVMFSGFLEITTAGTYTFAMAHDDGVRVVLGGETIILFPGDTAPRATGSAALTLAAGLYPLEIVSWEQGGLFLSQFSWLTPASGAFVIVPADALSHVPEPGTMALLGLVLAMLGVARRRAA